MNLSTPLLYSHAGISLLAPPGITNNGHPERSEGSLFLRRGPALLDAMSARSTGLGAPPSVFEGGLLGFSVAAEIHITNNRHSELSEESLFLVASRPALGDRSVNAAM
jgi:hypothetical protein